MVAVPRVKHAWVLLTFAIISEVFATASLRAGVDDPTWNLAATAGYLSAFVLLGLTLRAGMAVGSAYAIWGALGVVLTALVGTLVFSESLTVLNWFGVAAIVLGVVLVEGGHSPSPNAAQSNLTQTSTTTGESTQ